MTMRPTMNDFFSTLDKWRHFAGFSLEPRSEALFALFLPIVFERFEGVAKINPLVIPQFPLKKEGNNQSNNVDFFALSDDCEKGYLIELKTDMNSIDKNQKCYLRRAKRRGMRKVLEDLTTIAQVERPEHLRKKYFHLLSALDELRLIELQDTLRGKMYGNDPTGVYREIKRTDILASPALEVVYIQPRKPKKIKEIVEEFKYIYFDEFADIVESQGDMGGLFAGYLRKWKKDPATSPPSKNHK